MANLSEGVKQISRNRLLKEIFFAFREVKNDLHTFTTTLLSAQGAEPCL